MFLVLPVLQVLVVGDVLVHLLSGGEPVSTTVLLTRPDGPGGICVGGRSALFIVKHDAR